VANTIGYWVLGGFLGIVLTLLICPLSYVFNANPKPYPPLNYTVYSFLYSLYALYSRNAPATSIQEAVRTTQLPVLRTSVLWTIIIHSATCGRPLISVASIPAQECLTICLSGGGSSKLIDLKALTRRVQVMTSCDPFHQPALRAGKTRHAWTPGSSCLDSYSS